MSDAAAPTRTYRGMTAADRVQERRERLIAAGLQMFGTRGIAAARVDDICAEAGLTKRYFYESFSSPDGLVQAVLEDVLAGLTARVLPAIATGGWLDPRPAISTFVNALLADPRLVRLLVVETHSGALVQQRHELIGRAVDIWLTTDPRADHDPVYLPAQRLLAHAYAGAVGEVALAWTNGRIDLPAETITDQLVRLFHRIAPAKGSIT